MKKLISIAYETPSEEIEHAPFDSDLSLIDADIIILKHDISEFLWRSSERYMGKSSLSNGASFRLRERADHWRTEILDAFTAGKTVIVFLSKLEEVYIATCEKQYAGTGRNRVTTRIVTSFYN